MDDAGRQGEFFADGCTVADRLRDGTWRLTPEERDHYLLVAGALLFARLDDAGRDRLLSSLRYGRSMLESQCPGVDLAPHESIVSCGDMI